MSAETPEEEVARLRKGLEDQREAHQEHVERLLEAFQKERQVQKRVSDAAIAYERLQRASAQQGLVPYVRALEEFDTWLRKHKRLRGELEPVMRELGIWEIKLGYDPDRDLTLSLVSPKHPAYSLGATSK